MSRRKSLLIIVFLSLLGVSTLTPLEKTFKDEDCLSCHGKKNIFQLTPKGEVRTLYVNPEEWERDIHRKSQMTCITCHKSAHPYFHFREGYPDVDCARCHPEEAEEYQKNIHLTFSSPSPGKELPACHHCHTKHHVLRHDDPLSSVHEKNIGDTCGSCHQETMVKGILKGSSLGKLSGHRKGDISEKFQMKICINCHYEDAAHGAKRVYKEYCSSCHNPLQKPSIIIGPIHLDSRKWAPLNFVSSALILLIIIGIFAFFGYKSRMKIISEIKSWLKE